LIAHGHFTPTFTQRKEQLPERTCLSVVSRHTILDIQNDDPNIVEYWVKGLRALLGQSDEDARKLQQELVNNPPDPRKKKTRRRGGEGRSKTVEKGKPKEKQRTESLILLQKDLFIMTTTTVFRSLEEQYYPVTQELKEQFNPNVMYQKALDDDVPWRDWQTWIQSEVIKMMKEQGMDSGKETKKVVKKETATAGGPTNKEKECSIQ